MAEAVKAVDITISVRGAEEAAAKLNTLAAAEQKLTVASDQTSRATLSNERAVDALQRRLDPLYRAQQLRAAEEQKIQKFVAAGNIDQARANELMALAAQRYGGVAAANDNLARASAAASAALSRVGVNVPVITAGTGVLAALGAVLGTVAVGAVSAVNAYRKFEEEHLALEAVIKATGFSAGRTSENIEELAADIGNIGEVRKAALELAQFRSIAGEVFDRTLRAADDLASAGFGSISSAAAALGRALESPEQGLTRLRRVGVIFTDTQIAMVREMQQTGRIADAQKYVLDELAKRIGGVGAARDQGLSGSYEMLGDATQKLLERWGKQITEGLRLTGILRGIAAVVDAAATPANPLADIDRRIGMAEGTLNAVGGLGGSIAAQARRRAEAELNKLLAERAEIVGKIAEEQKRAAEGAAAAAAERQAELIAGVVRELDKETEALRKNAYERAVDLAMRKAEVAPGSSGEAEIRRAVNTKLSTESTEQATESIRRQIDQLNIEAATLGMSTAAALEYRLVKDSINKAKERGITLSDEEVAKIREQAAALGKRTQEFDVQRNTFELMQKSGKDFTQTFAAGLLEGKSAADALAASMSNLAQQMLDAGVDNLLKGALTGNAVQAAIGGAELGLAFLIKSFADTGEEAKKAAEELAQAQEAWRQMANEAQKFNEAATGVVIQDVVTLLQEMAARGERHAGHGKAGSRHATQQKPKLSDLGITKTHFEHDHDSYQFCCAA